MNKYNIVSLGFFCSVSEELQEYGFRKESMPFDWLISSAEGVYNLIDNKFEDFLEFNELSQNLENRNFYKNDRYDVSFYHDFTQYKSLADQLESVVKKYNRRIKRFYERISEPTIFIRYIEDQNEMNYIEANLTLFLSLLTSYNKESKLLLICNNDIITNLEDIYRVQKDQEDTVARKPFSQLPSLIEYLDMNYDQSQKKDNLSFPKQETSNSLIDKIYGKLRRKYAHTKTHSDKDIL